MHTLTNTPFTAYLAADGFIQDLRQELIQAGHCILAEQERLLLASGPAYPAAWAQNIWHEPVWLPIDSIKHAARSLKALGRNWTLYATANHRRAALIQQELAPLPKKLLEPYPFGTPAPDIALGAWCLWQPGLVLAASRTASPFPHGEVHFAEDKINPPSRAYLKLWELFTLTGHLPGQRLCAGTGRRRSCRLGVFRYDLLPGQIVGTGGTLDRTRAVPPYCLHTQIPGRDRFYHHGPLWRGARLQPAAFELQPPRAHLGVASVEKGEGILIRGAQRSGRERAAALRCL